MRTFRKRQIRIRNNGSTTLLFRHRNKQIWTLITWQLEDDILILVLPHSVQVAQLVRDHETLGGRLRSLTRKEVDFTALPVIAEGGDLDGLGVHHHHRTWLDPIGIAHDIGEGLKKDLYLRQIYHLYKTIVVQLSTLWNCLSALWTLIKTHRLNKQIITSYLLPKSCR